MGGWPGHGGGARGRCEASVAHSAAGPLPLPVVRARRVELGHQLGQRLHGQPLLRRRQAHTHGAVSGGELIALHAVEPPYRHGGNDCLASFSLQAGGTYRACMRTIQEHPESLSRRARHTRSAENGSMLASAHAMPNMETNGKAGARCVRVPSMCDGTIWHHGVAMTPGGPQRSLAAR